VNVCSQKLVKKTAEEEKIVQLQKENMHEFGSNKHKYD
jgi:tRNA G37 N-methylase TrmD